MQELTAAVPALTMLSEEEELFRSTIREFTEREVAPHVHEMDEAGIFRPELIRRFFEQGLMAIEIPEQFGGAEAGIFLSVLAIEEMSRIDPAAAIYVDVHNTLVNNCVLRWANEEQRQRYLPRLASDLLGAYALSEPNSGSDAFALQCRAEQQDGKWVLNGQKMWITNGAEAEFFIVFATVDPVAGYKGITAFLVERDFPGFSVGKKEDKMGIRASSTTELILDSCQVPAENVLGPGRPGLQGGHRNAQRGAHRHRRADDRRGAGRAASGDRVRQGAPAVRKGDRRISGRPVPARAGARPNSRRRVSWSITRLASRTPARHSRQQAAMAKLFASQVGRAGDLGSPGAVRRVRLHQGIPGREVLPGRQDRRHLRGHPQHAAADHRQADAAVVLPPGRDRPSFRPAPRMCAGSWPSPPGETSILPT